MEAIEGEKDFDKDELLEFDFNSNFVEKQNEVPEACSIVNLSNSDCPSLRDDFHVAIEKEVLEKMTIAELKNELEKRSSYLT